MKVVFIVTGYDRYEPQTGNYYGSVQIEVFAKTEKQALEKAESYIKKEGYRVAQVIEIDPEISRNVTLKR